MNWLRKNFGTIHYISAIIIIALLILSLISAILFLAHKNDSSGVIFNTVGGIAFITLFGVMGIFGILSIITQRIELFWVRTLLCLGTAFIFIQFLNAIALPIMGINYSEIRMGYFDVWRYAMLISIGATTFILNSLNKKVSLPSTISY